MLREPRFLDDYRQIGEFGAWRKLDEEKLKGMIAEGGSAMERVDVGMEEDWSCADEYWSAESGYNKRFAGVKESRWATPAARIVFRDGEELIFACEKRKAKKDGFWARILHLFSKSAN